MKSILLSCLLSLFSLSIICQETKVELVDFYCRMDESVPISVAKNRIVRQNYYGGALIVVIEVVSSYAGVHKAKVKLVDDTLQLFFREKDEVLYETNEKGERKVIYYKEKNQCQFVLTYKINGLSGNNRYDIELNRERLKLSSEGYKYTAIEKIYLEKNPKY